MRFSNTTGGTRKKKSDARGDACSRVANQAAIL